MEGLGAGLDSAWNATRAVANAVWIPGDGGKLVLLGPRPRDGAHAGALGAALENTARTLSIEWARHAIRTTAVLPGDATTDEDVAHARRLPRLAGRRLLQRLRVRDGPGGEPAI